MSDEAREAAFTPTTEQVRAEYVTNRAMRVPTTHPVAAEFDQWLTAHDREVAAKALEDARVRPEPCTRKDEQ